MMNCEIEQIINDIKYSLSDVTLGYSAGQSVDRKYCSICGADDVIKYQTSQNISMDTLEHKDSCAYSLIRKLENKIN